MVFSKKNPEEASDSLLFENPWKKRIATISKTLVTVVVFAFYCSLIMISCVAVMILLPMAEVGSMWLQSGLAISITEVFLSICAVSLTTLAIIVGMGVIGLMVYLAVKTAEEL